MRRKFLSVVLCVCMMMTMAPFAFATGSDDTSTTNTQEQAPVANSSSGGSGGSTTSVSLPNDNTGDLTISKDNAVLDGSGHTYTNGTITVTAANVTIQNLTFGDKAALVVNTTGKFTLTGCTFTPTTAYTKGSNNQTLTSVRTAVTLNVGEAVVTNNTFDGVTGGYYNAIEFGIGPKQNNLSKATISGNAFNKAIKNNYFNFYNMTADAVIDITGNHFLLAKKGSNAIRISNFRNVSGVTFNVNNNEYTYANDSDESQYEGFILLEDYSPEGDTVQDFSGITININNLTSPSNAKQLFYVYDDQDRIIARNQPIVKGDSSISKFCSARIGDTYYASLVNAVADASTTNPDTIKLLKDTTERLILNGGKEITLDLGGNTLSYTEQTVRVNHGKLTVNGPGAIKEINPNLGAILIKGSTNQEDTNYSVVNVNGDVTLSGWAPVFVDQNSEKAYGVTVNLNGATLKAQKDTGGNDGVGLYVNGSIKDTVNAPVIKLENTTIDAQGEGMYLAGYADTTIKSGSIVGTQTGIEIRAGKLDINGATVIGNGIPTKITPNGNGSTAEGAGIAVMQHTSKLPIDVTISDGTISGYTGLLEANPQKNSAEDIAKVNIKVTGGKFSAINGGTNSISSDDKTGFITGGLFSSDPTPYCGKTEGEDNKQLAGIENTNSATKAQYPFTVGILDLATDVDVAPAAPATKAETTGKDQNVVPVMNSAATAAAGTTATGLDAIGGNEATKVTTSEVNEAKARLSQTDGVTVGDQTVTLYVQPYLDITVTDADVTTSSEGAASTINSLSLNIIPMVKKVASTATSVENIELNPGNETGKTKNATVISTTEVKNVNTPVTITLPLPSGFASSTTDKLSIKHTKANGSVEYYTGTVTSAATGQGEDAVTTYYVTFTTNGFSPFVIYAASANVASIGDNVYPSLQAAIDAVQDNQTITLLKDTDENVTVSKAVKFTLDTTSSNFTGSITAGSRYTLTQSGNTYTVTRQSSSSSGSTSTTYDVNVNAATNGAVAADKKTASKGTTVTVTASPSKGYVVDAVKVVDKDGKDVAVTGKDGKYVFTMPASAVTVTGSFKAETPAPVALPFTDVKSGNWFYDAVKYAYAQGLMTGTSATTFAPNGTMNRAMIVTVLYRLEKSPAVTGASKFTDVPAGQWYSDAVAWAAANKIVNGYDETTFGPMNAVTREQMAAILFRYEQVKGLENVTLEENLNRFPDQNKISAYAIPALQWAVGQKIINGNADGTLDPTGTATRAQVAQIFTNLLNK